MNDANKNLCAGLVLGALAGFTLSMPVIQGINIRSDKPITHTKIEITIKNGVSDTIYILER